MEKPKLTLNDAISSFAENYNNKMSVKDLTHHFDELAKWFLYGGYINVYGKYRIYIRTVEFYFHSELENGIKDPIVYHRNGRYINGTVPYFPLMSFHTHASGIDITFENEDKEYRASALIRAYEVYEVHKENEKNEVDNNKFLVYKTDAKKFVPWECKDNQFNTQSTYIYNFLNGFESDLCQIRWVDDERPTPEEPYNQTPRQNVFQSTNDEVYEPKTDDKNKKILDINRQWRYFRIVDIPTK